VGEVVVFLIVVAIVAVVGVVFGRVVAAPALRRLADRVDEDEESGDRPA
jgi:hypothetical protein